MNTSYVQRLAAARLARKQGQRKLAAELYRECWAADRSVAREYAGLFYEAGDFVEAERIVSMAMGLGDSDADLYFLRGLARMAGANPRGAADDFSTALAHSEASVPLLFNRGLALFKLDRVQEALADFRAVTILAPEMDDAWANIGILYQRSGESGQAVAALQRANEIRPNNPTLMRHLANALRAAGRAQEALRLHERVAALLPDEPDALTDHGLCLLHTGQAAAALQHYSKALAITPGNQTALAGLYLCFNETKQHEQARMLMDYPRLLGCSRQDTLDIAPLRKAALSHPELTWEPAGRSTRHGQQSTMLDLAPTSPFAGFAETASRCVDLRILELLKDPALRGHPWLRARPARWRLQAWITILAAGGQQSPHIHPAGWMSGVLYIDAGQRALRSDGALVFGHAPEDIKLSSPALEWEHIPSSGQLVTFPSYFFHHTRPYCGTSPRISIAFDVMPA